MSMRFGRIFFVSVESASRRPSRPSMRGTEKPQMSASMTPTAKPSVASAAARFTVTDDLPTPPLPEAIMITLVVGGMAVVSGRSAMLRRARSIATAFSAWVSSVQSIFTRVTPGSEATRALTSFCIWALSGHPAVVRAMPTCTVPSGSTCTCFAIPSSTMSEPSSGSMTPAEQVGDLVGCGKCVVHVLDRSLGPTSDRPAPARVSTLRRGGSFLFYRSGRVFSISGSTIVGWRPPTSSDDSTERGSANRLDLLKTLGDNTRYAIYLELARSPRPLATSDVAESLGLHANTVRPHLERMRDVGLLETRPDTRGAVGRPQKLYSWPPTRRRSVSSRRCSRCSPACCWTSSPMRASWPTPRSMPGAPRASAWPTAPRSGPGPCAEAAIAMLDELGFDPAAVDDEDATVVGVRPLPVRRSGPEQSRGRVLAAPRDARGIRRRGGRGGRGRLPRRHAPASVPGPAGVLRPRHGNLHR